MVQFIMAGEAWQQEQEVAGHSEPQSREMNTQLSSFHVVRTVAPPTLRMGLPASVKPFGKHQRRHTQRHALMVILNPVKLLLFCILL